MTLTLEQIIDRWNSGEGKPYKGSLIDWDSYDGDGIEPPENMGCMCAQGQVLHLIGGWEPRRIADTEQAKADEETAKLLNISRAHAILLRSINDKQDGAPAIVLTNPEKVLGDQAHIVLAFWLHIDRMIDKDWAAARAAAGAAAWVAAGYACCEIQGARLLRERKQPFFFLPMFGFDSPEGIPPLPADYGKVAL